MVVRADWTFRAEGVTKVYNGTLRANDSITLSVEPGEVYGLLGPNGAGDSSLVKQVIGLLKPTEGRITVWPGRVVILDEPTSDVDPLRRRLLRMCTSG